MNLKQKRIFRITAIYILALLFLLAGSEIWVIRKIETTAEQAIRNQGGIPNKVDIGNISINPLKRRVRLNNLLFHIEFPSTASDINLKIDHLVIEEIRLQRGNGITFEAIDLHTPILTLSRHSSESLLDSTRRDTTTLIKPNSKLKKILSKTIHITDGSIRIIENKNNEPIIHSFQHVSFSTGPQTGIASGQSSISTETDFQLSIRQIQYRFDRNALQFEADTLIVSRDSIHLTALRLLPLYTREEFAELAPEHADWIQISSRNISGYGINLLEWILHKNFTADSIDIGTAHIESYKNRNITQEQRIKPLFFQLLNKIPNPIDIQSVGFRNINALYSELVPGKNTPGTISFNNISGSCNGITNRPENSGQNIVIQANGLLQNTVPMQLDLVWPAGSSQPQFIATGKMGSMDLSLMNSITIPIADLQIDRGKVHQLSFRITGDSTQAETELTMLYDSLQIELIHRKNGIVRERKLLSTVLDDFILIPDNPHLGKTRIGTGTTLRNPYRSQFNYLWKSIETGIKSTLIDRHIKHDKPHRSRYKNF